MQDLPPLWLLGSTARGPMGMPAEWAASSSKKNHDTIKAFAQSSDVSLTAVIDIKKAKLMTREHLKELGTLAP